MTPTGCCEMLTQVNRGRFPTTAADLGWWSVTHCSRPSHPIAALMELAFDPEVGNALS